MPLPRRGRFGGDDWRSHEKDCVRSVPAGPALYGHCALMEYTGIFAAILAFLLVILGLAVIPGGRPPTPPSDK